jgi:DNA-binding NarL/FixJ family response regulator
MKDSGLAFLDQRIPGYQREIINIIGMGVVENLDDPDLAYFAQFTPQRLFTPIGSNILDVNFFLPGTNTPATVSAFGSIFSDVDLTNTTSLQLFDGSNISLGTFFVPAAGSSQRFSFLGIVFNAGEQIGRVRITNGNAALGAGVLDGTSDVVVMDVGMPELNGVEATLRIRNEFEKVNVIALSTHKDKRYVHHMLEAGACGYVLKVAAHDELVQAVRAASLGRTYLSREIAGMVVERSTSVHTGGDVTAFSTLGAREREVLQLVAEGKTSSETAREMHISIKTVETHRRNIVLKLGLRGTAELTHLVDSHKATVAFSMYPTTVSQLMAIADAGQIMPPKSTWFEPKLRSGLFIHLY